MGCQFFPTIPNDRRCPKPCLYSIDDNFMGCCGSDILLDLMILRWYLYMMNINIVIDVISPISI